MLTIFTSPKAFCGHDGVIQRNAILSWMQLKPNCEIILFGDDDGTAEFAKRLGLIHVPDVATTELGTPLLSDMFRRAQDMASHDLICYANADIIFLSNLTEQIQNHRDEFPDRFMAVGRRWNLDQRALIDFNTSWEIPLRKTVAEKARLGASDGIDFFIYQKGLFRDIPEFAIGRPGWDNWLIYSAGVAEIDIIDVTSAITAIHQNHGYGHVPSGTGKAWEGPEGHQNRRLALNDAGTIKLGDYTVDRAQLRLTWRGLSPNRTVRRWVTAANRYVLSSNGFKIYNMSRWLLKKAIFWDLIRLAPPTPPAPKAPATKAGKLPVSDMDFLVPQTTAALSLERMGGEPSTWSDGPQLLFSIIVCTYNRAELLPTLFDSLLELDLDTSKFEVIVVDNNSSDQTKTVAERYMERAENFRYVFEPKQGLSHARNRGRREALAQYVGYVDDECRVPSNWLNSARALVLDHNPEVFGGSYAAFFDKQTPVWYRRPYFSTLWKGNRRREFDKTEYLDGANIFVRNDVFDRIGEFDTGLGMTGNTVAFGEETDFQMRVRTDIPGALILFDPNLTIEHMVRTEKVSLVNMIRTKFAGGRSAYKVLHENIEAQNSVFSSLVAFGKFLAGAAVGVAAITSGMVWRNKFLYPHPQNHHIEVGLPKVQRAGRLWAQFIQTRGADMHDKTGGGR